MNTVSKIILIFCIWNVPTGVLAQNFNTIQFKREYAKVRIALPSVTDTTIKEDYLKPDTLTKTESASLYENTKAAFCSMPLKKILPRSMFGYRIHPILKKWMFHSGIDLSARTAVVYSILDGVIEKTAYSPTLGYYIVVNHGTVKSIYGHLSYIAVSKDEVVQAGEGIAITGKTGRVTGEHLHFMISYQDKIIDPWPYLKYLFKIQMDSKIQTIAIHPVKHSIGSNL